MIFRTLRFIITSCFVIGICSININERPLFNYIYKYSKKVVDPVQESTQGFIKKSYYRTVHFSRQFFNNNLPTADSLDYQLSAPEREEVDYSDFDRKKLDEVFRK